MTRTSKHRRRNALTAITAALAAALLIALTGSSAAAAKSNGTLILYNGQHEQTTDSLVAGFEQKTGINVEVRDDDEDTLADELVTEGSHSPADVIYTENSLPLQYLSEKGLLAQIDPSTLAHTASKYNSANGQWLGVSARVSVLIYNPKLISASQLPTHVSQLADPEYKGRLAFAAGETDFQPVVTSYDHTYGQAATLKWLDGIKANAGSHIYPDNETIADEVNRGAVAFGLINQYYWYRMVAELGKSNVPSRIVHLAPRDPGYVLDISGAAILKSAKNKKAAQEFLAYIVSKQGQETIAHSISYEYPIDDGVTTAAPETPFDQLQPNPITIHQLGDGQLAISLLRKAGLL